MRRTTIDGDDVLLLADDELRALRGGFGWALHGPFARTSDPGVDRDAALAVEHRLAPQTRLRPGDLDVLLTVMRAAVEGPRPLPRGDWRTLTLASDETARQVLAALARLGRSS